MNQINPLHHDTDPWADKQPHCTIYPADARLGGLLRDLVGSCLKVDDDAELPGKFVVVVDCLHSAASIAKARDTHPGRPLVAVVARPNAVEVFEALAANADGVLYLTDPATTWRDCLNVVLGGGRWFDGPGLEVKLEHKYARYDIAKGSEHDGDVTMRTRSFVSKSVKDKLHR